MGTQSDVCVSCAPFLKQVLLALGMGVSSTDGIRQVLPMCSPEGSGSLESAPLMLQEENLEGQVTVK